MCLRLACLSAAAIAFSGCAFRMGDLSIVSSKNVALNPEPIKRSAEGKNCLYFLLGLIPITGFVPNLEEAMDQAIEQVADGNLLTDIAIYNEFTYFVVASEQCIRVKGDVGRVR
jgi:hypothetical protein